MSAQLLRDGARGEIQELEKAFVDSLLRRKEDTLDQMRFNQGVLHGLEMARNILDYRFRNLNG